MNVVLVSLAPNILVKEHVGDMQRMFLNINMS